MSDEARAALLRIAAGAKAADCESSTLEFKEDRGDVTHLEDALVKTAICFANSGGGTLVVGVANGKAGAEAFTGTSLDADRLRQRIAEKTEPRLVVETELILKPVRLVLVSVRQSAALHADKQGRSWQRINRDCLSLSPADWARLTDERRGYDWSAEPSDRDMESVSREALDMARALLRNQPDEERRMLAVRSDADLLSALGVLVDRRRLKRAGELLFCPAAGGERDLLLYQYRQTPGGEPRAVHRLSSPLVMAFQRTLDLIVARQDTTPVTLPNGQQIMIEDFPRDGIREALSNAVCHRDWRATGLIMIDHAPEVLAIVSPGPLVTGVTPENILTTPSSPRNPCLAKAARLLGFAEETGRGVDRMYRAAIRSGKQVPQIIADFDRVRVAFAGGAPDTNIARFVAQLPREEQDDTDTMLVIHRLCSARTITAEQVSPLLQKPVREVAMILRRLTSDSLALLEPTRETAARRSPTFRLRGEALRMLGAAVAYNRRTADDTDRKIIAHLREYGRVTNRTLQNMFDISVFKARDILGDLAARGIVERVSTQTRGPKVEWGPGPRFPRKRRDTPMRDVAASSQPNLPGILPRRRKSDAE